VFPVLEVATLWILKEKEIANEEKVDVKMEELSKGKKVLIYIV